MENWKDELKNIDKTEDTVGKIASRSARVKDVKVCPQKGCKNGKMADGSTCPLCLGEGFVSTSKPTY